MEFKNSVYIVNKDKFNLTNQTILIESFSMLLLKTLNPVHNQSRDHNHNYCFNNLIVVLYKLILFLCR